MYKGSIAFYSKSVYYGGIERNIVNHALILKEKGYNIFIISKKGSTIAKTSKKNDVDLIVIENDGLGSTRKLVRVLIEKNVRSVFISRANELSVGLLIRVFSLSKIKVIYFQQDNLNFKKIKLYKTWLLKLTNYWVTPLQYIHYKAKRNPSFVNKNILIIPHFLRLDLFYNSNLSAEEARTKLSLPHDRKIIGIMGRQNLEKRQDFLIRAINFLKLNNYLFDLVIMGNPKREEEKEYAQFLQELSEECGLVSQIYFRPYPAEIITFYKAIDVYVRTTSGEACDITSIEAMTSGTPVLSVQSDYNSEIMENGNLGMLYKANDLEDFSSKLIKLLTHKKIIEHAKTEVLNSIVDKYDSSSKIQPFEQFVRHQLE